MKKSSNKSNAIVSPIENKKESLKEINFEKFANALENVSVKEKKSKDALYIYPDGWTSEMINSDAGKSWRGNKRNKIKSFCNNILSYAKTKQSDLLNAEIEKFKSFYLEFYSINDFSLNSISRSNQDNHLLSLTLEIVKETL